MTSLQEIIISSTAKSKEIQKLEDEGLLRKIAPRIYTSIMKEQPSKIIRRNWYRVISDLFPDSFLSHRSALERIPTSGGHIYLTRSYKGRYNLPGLIIHFNEGPAPLEDDELFFGNTRASGLARAWLENLQQTTTGGQESKILNRISLEEKIELFLRVKGADAVNKVRERAREIAPQLNMEKEWIKLNRLLTDMLGTGLSKNLVSPIAKARVLGEPVDPERLRLFESLYAQLIQQPYPDYPEKNTSTRAYKNFAFFESYFSNYIEGTEFTLEEARLIINSGMPIPARDEDSHDVLGTYQIVSDRTEMSVKPTNPDHFLQLLKQHHAILLHARKSKKPGEFKDINNRAGTTEFVDWELTPGTLKKGFDWYTLLQHPFAKAAYMMFLVSEVHPFLDGNGRIARVMMNIELTAAGLSKIIIPTVYREDYLGVLKKLTKQGAGEAYIRMLLRAWEFSSRIHGNSINDMEQYLVDSNAFMTHREGRLKIASPDH